MRILHTSDWHLGRSFHREGMLTHQAAYVDHLLEVVEREQVDLVRGRRRRLRPRAAPRRRRPARRRGAGPAGRLPGPGRDHQRQPRLRPAAGLQLPADRRGRRVHPHRRRQRRHARCCSRTSTARSPSTASPTSTPTRSASRGGCPPAPTRPRWPRRCAGCGPTSPAAAAAPARSCWRTRSSPGAEPSDSERDISVGGVSTGADLDLRRRSTTSRSATCTAGTRSPTSVRYSGSPLAYSFSEATSARAPGWSTSAPTGLTRAEFVEAPVPRPLARLRGALESLLADPSAGRPRGRLGAGHADRRRAAPRRRWSGCARRFPHTLVLGFEPAPAAPPPRRAARGRRAAATTRSRSTSSPSCGAPRPPTPSPRCSARRSTPAARTPTSTCWSRRPAEGCLMRLHHLEVTAFGPFADTVVDRLRPALRRRAVPALRCHRRRQDQRARRRLLRAVRRRPRRPRQRAKRLRSDQAAPGVAPRVVLEATLSGRRFRIERSPAWERPKKRGTGHHHRAGRRRRSASGSTASWSPSPPASTRPATWSPRLVGMNLAQFTQVAMLPQGRFQAFLRARSEERHQLLQQLFRTGRFEDVERWLRERRLALRRRVRGAQRSVADLVSRVSEADRDALPRRLGPARPRRARGGPGRCWRGRPTCARRPRPGPTADARRGRGGRRVRGGRAPAARRGPRPGPPAPPPRRARAEHARLGERGRGPRRRARRPRRGPAGRPRGAAGTAGGRSAPTHERGGGGGGPVDGGRRGDARPALRRPRHPRAGGRGSRPTSRQGAGRPPPGGAATRPAGRDPAVEAPAPVADRDAGRDPRDQARRCPGRSSSLRRRRPRPARPRPRRDRLGAEVEVLRGRIAAAEQVATVTVELAVAREEWLAAKELTLTRHEALLALRQARIDGMAAELAGALAVGACCPVCGSRRAPAQGERRARLARRRRRAERPSAPSTTPRPTSWPATCGSATWRPGWPSAGEKAGPASREDLQAQLGERAALLAPLRDRAGRRDHLAAALEAAEAELAAARRPDAGARSGTPQRSRPPSTSAARQVAALARRGVGPARRAPASPTCARCSSCTGPASRRASAQCARVDELGTARDALVEAERSLAEAVTEAGFDDEEAALAATLTAERLAALERRGRATTSAASTRWRRCWPSPARASSPSGRAARPRGADRAHERAPRRAGRARARPRAAGPLAATGSPAWSPSSRPRSTRGRRCGDDLEPTAHLAVVRRGQVRRQPAADAAVGLRPGLPARPGRRGGQRAAGAG